MKVFLIGLPGSGKSTIGKKFAGSYGMQFLDLDEVIEKSEGASILEIFTKFGENYFRKKETEYLLRIINEKDDFILATGGGTPCYFSNLKMMKETGEVFFINTPLDIIAERLASEKDKRPLISENVSVLERLIELLKNRQGYYEQADHTANNDEEFSELLKKVLNK